MSDKSENLAVYGIYVQTITANEQRRQALAAFYLSLVAAGIALLASDKITQYVAIAIPISIVSIVWFSTIKYFRNLAKAKFKVIEELENDFFIKPFAKEWEFYKSAGSRFRISLTHIELIIPATIFVVSTSYVLYSLYQFIKLWISC